MKTNRNQTKNTYKVYKLNYRRGSENRTEIFNSMRDVEARQWDLMAQRRKILGVERAILTDA